MSLISSAWSGRIAAAAVALGWWGWTAMDLARGADRMDLGYLFYLGLVSFGLLAWVAGRWSGRELPRLEPLSALFVLLTGAVFVQGAQASAAELFSITAFPWYVAAGALLWVAVQFHPVSQPSAAVRVGAWRGPVGTAALVLTAVLLAALILWADRQIHTVWTLFEDRTSTSLFFFRRSYNATDLGGTLFRDYGLLVWPFAYALLIAASAAWLAVRGRLGSPSAFWWLLAASLLGKLTLAHLSSSGVDIIGLKVSSINTAYYGLSQAIDEKGLWAYILDYNSIQFRQGAHGDTHPFGPMVLYWGLRHLLGGHVWLVGMTMALLCSLTLWPIHALARRAYGSAEAGFVAALIYLLSPAGLMLSSAGIDAFLALMLALMLERLDAAIRHPLGQGLLIRGATAGVLLFVSMHMGFGGAVVLVFGGLYALHQARALTGSLMHGAQRAVLALGSALVIALLLHLLLYLLSQGKVDYLTSMDTAAATHRAANFSRHYELWGWANVLLFAAYLGMGTLAAWVLRFGRALWAGDSRDGLLVYGAYQALMLAAASMGRGEVQREFLYGMLFLSLPATALLLKEENGRAQWGRVALVAGLNLMTAVFIQATVLDFW